MGIHPEGLFCPIDFQKAFDSVSHAYAFAFFEMLSIPADMTRLLMALFTAPIVPLVKGVLFRSAPIFPTSGVRQGCPLSPSVFAMLISPLAIKLEETSEFVRVLLYADDLLIIITLPPAAAAQVMIGLSKVLKIFTLHAGLHVNHGKSGILLKGQWALADQTLLSTLGFPIVTSYKYLGILVGHVTPLESFSLAISKAMKPAFAMRSWQLSLPERVMLFRLWILPLLVHPARIIFPTEVIVNTIYWTALCMTSWTVTQPILSLPLDQGGFSLPDPKTFLYHQHSRDV